MGQVLTDELEWIVESYKPKNKMKPAEHKKRHIELHKALDELFADFIIHYPNEIHFTQMPIIKLLEWSYQQTLEPTEKI